MQTVIESCNAARITGSSLIVTGAAGLMGIFVSQAAAAPTITVYDGVSAAAPATILVNTFTPIAGTFYPMPFLVGRGIFIAIANTVDATVAWGPVSA